MFWSQGTGRHAPFLRKDGKLQRRLDARTAALLGLTGQDAEQTTVVEEVEEEEQKTNSGLKTFVARVASWVYHNGTSNSAGMVDHLAREYVNMQTSAGSNKAKNNKETHLDDRSIRRRVYDALNVLNAIGVVSKATSSRREAEWVGYLRKCGPTDIERVVSSHTRTVQRVHSKARRLRHTLSLIAAYKQLAARNAAAASPPAPEQRVHAPFVVMGMLPGCSLRVQRVQAKAEELHGEAASGTEPGVGFTFSSPPVLLDDSAVMTAMGLGLPPLSPADVYEDEAHLRSQRVTQALQAVTLAAAQHLPAHLQEFAQPAALGKVDISQHALYFLSASYKDSAVDVGAPVQEEEAASASAASSVPTTLFAVSAEPEGEIAAIQARLYNAEHTRQQLAAILSEDASTRQAMAAHIQTAREIERRTTAAIRAAKSEAKASRSTSSSKKRPAHDRDSSSSSTGSRGSGHTPPAAGGILGGELHFHRGRKRERTDSDAEFEQFNWQGGSSDSRAYLYSTSGERAPGLSELLDTALAWPNVDGSLDTSATDLNSSFGSASFAGGRRGVERFSAAASMARQMGGFGGGMPPNTSSSAMGGLPSAANMGMARTSGVYSSVSSPPPRTAAAGAGTGMSLAQRLANATPRTAATAALLAGVSPRTAEAASNIAGMTRRLSSSNSHTPARASGASRGAGLASVLSPSTADAAVALVQVGSSIPSSGVSSTVTDKTFDV